jgi:orotidine 5'-phosphate decarboxylase subfamily 1
MLTYTERAKLCSNPTARRLLNLIDEKKTNLAIAVDVTTSKQLLEIAASLGSKICVLKTHIDIIEDFSPELTQALSELAKKYNFLLFEDRKFADIGNTVKLQYGEGIYRIADWSHIINAHTVPGFSIIEGLRQVGLDKDRGLLLLAEMSTAGNLAQGEYTTQSLELAKKYSDFVIGFITTRKLMDDPAFIYFTPGVNLSQNADSLGQRYVTPQTVIYENESDIIIVGRGIYEAPNPLEKAEEYQQAGWDAYQQRLQKNVSR